MKVFKKQIKSINFEIDKNEIYRPNDKTINNNLKKTYNDSKLAIESI